MNPRRRKFMSILTWFVSSSVQPLERPPTLAALISSSARHSAMVLMFLKAASLAPVHSSQMACRRRRKVRHCRHSNWFGTTELWCNVSESVIDWATRGYSQWINKENFLYECSSTPGQWVVSRRDSSLAQHIRNLVVKEHNVTVK